jgi:hypothetical protein
MGFSAATNVVRWIPQKRGKKACLKERSIDDAEVNDPAVFLRWSSGGAAEETGFGRVQIGSAR